MMYKIANNLVSVPSDCLIPTPSFLRSGYFNQPSTPTVTRIDSFWFSIFSPSTIKLWNSIPPYIINSSIHDQFCDLLDNYQYHTCALWDHIDFCTKHQITIRLLPGPLPACVHGRVATYDTLCCWRVTETQDGVASYLNRFCYSEVVCISSLSRKFVASGIDRKHSNKRISSFLGIVTENKISRIRL